MVCPATRMRASLNVAVWWYSGNTLAAWAELLAPQETIQMLVTAQQAYEAALNQESDAAVCHNIRSLHEQAFLHLYHVYAACVCIPELSVCCHQASSTHWQLKQRCKQSLTFWHMPAHSIQAL